MSLSRQDYDMIQTEFQLVQIKLDLLNETLSMIQKTTYEMLLEQVKTNQHLLTIINNKG